jgi:hypothetical protein
MNAFIPQLIHPCSTETPRVAFTNKLPKIRDYTPPHLLSVALVPLANPFIVQNDLFLRNFGLVDGKPQACDTFTSIGILRANVGTMIPPSTAKGIQFQNIAAKQTSNSIAQLWDMSANQV